MVSVCLADKVAFGVVCAQREGLAVVGCTAEIVRILEKYPDGRMDILCQGAKRFESIWIRVGVEPHNVQRDFALVLERPIVEQRMAYGFT